MVTGCCWFVGVSLRHVPWLEPLEVFVTVTGRWDTLSPSYMAPSSPAQLLPRVTSREPLLCAA